MSRMHKPVNPVWERPDPDTQRGPNKKIRCPRCGGLYANLPNHLPGCDGGDA